MGDILPLTIDGIIVKLEHKIGTHNDDVFMGKLPAGHFKLTNYFLRDIIDDLKSLKKSHHLSTDKKHGFLLLAENGTHPPKYEHHDIEDAHNEAQRLAILTRGNVSILHKIAVVAPDFSVVLNTKSYDSSVIESSKIEKVIHKHDDLPF